MRHRQMLKELRTACIAEQIIAVSPHDQRRAAAQWMVDFGVPIELVSKLMRHSGAVAVPGGSSRRLCPG